MTPEMYNRIAAGVVNAYSDLCKAWDALPEEAKVGMKEPVNVARACMVCKGKANRTMNKEDAEKAMAARRKQP